MTADGKRTLDQNGTLAEFLSADDLRAEVRATGHTDLKRGLIFGGTLAVAGGFAYGDRFECRLRDPVLGTSLTCDYAVG